MKRALAGLLLIITLATPSVAFIELLEDCCEDGGRWCCYIDAWLEEHWPY